MSLEVWLQAPKMVLANLFQSLCHLSIFLAEYDVFFFLLPPQTETSLFCLVGAVCLPVV